MTPSTPSYAPPAPSSSPTALIAKVLAAVGAVGLTGYAAFLLAFRALITYTGCFFDCFEPDRAAGLALATLAAATLACGPLAVAGLFRSRAWLGAAAGVFVLALLAELAVLLAT
jgi:hypothetical protein